MISKNLEDKLQKFMKKYGFRSYKVDCGELVFVVEKTGEEMVIREFKRKSQIHRDWAKLDEEVLSEGPEWAEAGKLPDIPKNVTLSYAAKSLEKAKKGTLDFAFWWWKILEKMRDLRDGKN